MLLTVISEEERLGQKYVNDQGEMIGLSVAPQDELFPQKIFNKLYEVNVFKLNP